MSSKGDTKADYDADVSAAGGQRKDGNDCHSMHGARTMNAAHRRWLARAMFESIPWEHRLGVNIYGGRSWSGCHKPDRHTTAVGEHVLAKPNLDYLENDRGNYLGSHPADD